jgi:hypothetical protein
VFACFSDNSTDAASDGLPDWSAVADEFASFRPAAVSAWPIKPLLQNTAATPITISAKNTNRDSLERLPKTITRLPPEMEQRPTTPIHLHFDFGLF